VDSGAGNDFNCKFILFPFKRTYLILSPFTVAPSVEEIGSLNTVNDLINANVPVGANLPILSNVDGGANNVLNRECFILKSD